MDKKQAVEALEKALEALGAEGRVVMRKSLANAAREALRIIVRHTPPADVEEAYARGWKDGLMRAIVVGAKVLREHDAQLVTVELGGGVVGALTHSVRNYSQSIVSAVETRLFREASQIVSSDAGPGQPPLKQEG